MTALEWDKLVLESLCRGVPGAPVIHPGLPFGWGMAVLAFIALVSIQASRQPLDSQTAMTVQVPRLSLNSLPFWGNAIQAITTTPWLVTALKLVTVSLFLMVIWSGLTGTPLPSRNLATVLTWNIWWSGVILSVFFMGSAWCAICPWDALAGWLVRQRLWKRARPETSLNLRVPKALRNVWPALALFVVLTWLELGVGITQSPYATALLALAMLVLTIATLVIFERKAFCRFVCPVGRTIGFYSQLAPVELRPITPKTCASCTTLECYHGSQQVDPCPTHQVMGTMKQNTFCISCGNCARSCPHDNVGWWLRSPASEAMQGARPHWDEAWFMVILLALTGFHGLTMMEGWEKTILGLSRLVGDSGQMLWSFSLGMVTVMAIPVALYAGAVRVMQGSGSVSFHDLFTRFSFVALPLAFAYHLAHNLAHLLREGRDIGALFANPTGFNTLPLSSAERHFRMIHMAIPADILFALQAALLALGFWVSVLVIRRRSTGLNNSKGNSYLLPLMAFAAIITAYHLWMLMQPMVMKL